MHGRLKVKTTAEQEEEKRKEREKKLQLFKAGAQKIAQKRNCGELDHELLSVISQLLVPHPEVYTFWNIRKEALLHMENTLSKDELQNLAQEELMLTEACLRTNPKTYGPWHHRMWVMQHMPEPNWTRDLRLCNRFLDIDERNFHCWDYRRYVCKNAQVSPAEELDFTMQKIEANFSNYSAWHNRSLLLPLVYPSTNGAGSVAEDRLLQEYDLVQNAAFTDPADQSAWFYHRWLLGRGQRTLELDLLYVSRESRRLVVHSTQPLMVNSKHCSLELFIDGNLFPVSWACPATHLASPVWYCSLSEALVSGEHEFNIRLACGKINSQITCCLMDSQDEAWNSTLTNNSCIFRSELSAAATSVLEQELESCNQLRELEPDNKWPLLTCILLMRALNAPKYEDQVMESLANLAEVDPIHRNYYSDLRSKFILENTTENAFENTRELSLADTGLSAFYHADYLVLLTRLDLSRNQLHSLPQVRFLLCIKELLLDDNNLDDCRDIAELPQLNSLSLRNNRLWSAQNLKSLSSCPHLRSLNLEGNNICTSDSWIFSIKELLPNLEVLDGNVL